MQFEPQSLQNSLCRFGRGKSLHLRKIHYRRWRWLLQGKERMKARGVVVILVAL